MKNNRQSAAIGKRKKKCFAFVFSRIGPQSYVVISKHMQTRATPIGFNITKINKEEAVMDLMGVIEVT